MTLIELRDECQAAIDAGIPAEAIALISINQEIYEIGQLACIGDQAELIADVPGAIFFED